MATHDLDRPDPAGAFDLEEVLGARSRVAVLRGLVEEPWVPTWPAWIVNRTGLPRSTVWEALQRLGALGIVEPVVVEPRRQVPWRIPPAHPLIQPLRALFEAERVSRLSDAQRRAELDRKRQAYASLGLDGPPDEG